MIRPIAFSRSVVLPALSLLTALLACPAAGADADPVQVALVLRAAHLFDGVSGKLSEPGVVVVTGNRITAVGAGAALPANARIVDLGDATLMPGIIDAHVHLQGDSTDNWYKDVFDGIMRFPAEQAHYAAHTAKATLEAGVTTVRDLGSSDYQALGLRNAIRAGQIPGPRILVSNYAIGSTAGHADQDPYPPQRIAPAGPILGVCNGADECRAAVRYQIKFGADVIKFMASGGVLSQADPVDNVQLRQEEMNAIVSEAHAWGRKAAAHCHGDQAARMAIAAGVDSIEHGSFLEDDTLQEMKRKHVFLVPTLSALYFVMQKIDTFPPQIAAKARAAGSHIHTTFEHAVKIGVPIAMGTDAGVGPNGRNAVEFTLMTQYGMTAAQALAAGTSVGAELLGIADQTGSLVPGKLADVIAVAGNPLTAIGATEHPVLVMRDGVIYLGGGAISGR